MLAYKEEYLPDYTYSDYKEWEGDWELIEGIPYAMAPSPNITHQELNSKIMYELMTKLKNCSKCKALPEIDWKIDEKTVLRPDSLVVCNLKKNSSFLTQTPTIIFEVLSISTKLKDRNLKSLIYAQNGVKYLVLVEPVGMYGEVYKLDKDEYILQGKYKDESYTFEISKECSIEFSFEEIFQGVE